ncbi:diguanylate cyclase [Spirulina sp. CS-785/01]|uniref:GGDEF domain-containing response regulator n=1 Tax=Spirulina sp. CS-785/01 TaxID=3021716 RepID=UPI00232E0CE3|nr:diguanylate cyclase [Spirulina sp. CS-785/01]MDB9313136.1 diguanylate cyclase [Spirulina sp. CS-785/01]
MNTIKVLLVEDSSTDADLLQENLAKVTETYFEVIHAPLWEDAIAHLQTQNFDIILLDLMLPDKRGLETVKETYAIAPDTPIMVLTGLDDNTIALEAVREGAQDYLVKGQWNGKQLVREIHHAIDRASILAELRQQREREHLLAAIAQRMNQSLRLKTIFDSTVKELRDFLQVKRVALYQLNHLQQGQFVAESVTHPQHSVLGQTLNSSHFHNHYAQQFPQGYLVALTDIQKAGLSMPELYNLQKLDIKALLLVPIVLEQRVWGFLCAHECQQPRQWSSETIELLQTLSVQLAIAIQQSQLYHRLAQANQELQRLVSIDGLTQIANRRHFDVYLHQEWQRLLREQQPLSLILCDLDHFKPYNDHYGHLQGDECLRQIAQALSQESKRPADLVARYGGEEFALILPNTPLNGAMHIAETLRQRVEQLNIPHCSSPISPVVTISLGIATLIPKSNPSPETLIQDADQALYAAKNQRNCYSVHRESVQAS